MSLVKFTKKARRVFLEELALTGRRYHSAKVANICFQTVRNHMKDDPGLENEMHDALDQYAEAVRQEVHRRGVKGWLEAKFEKGIQSLTPKVDPETGEFMREPDPDNPGETRYVLVPAFIRKYSDRMLELEAKRADPSYRDKSTVDMNVKGGVIVVPEMKSEKDWEDGS